MRRPLLSWFLTVSVVLSTLCCLERTATAAGENNPTGVARAMHANGEIHSAGSYSAYTGSMSRRVVDLEVPGGVGGYPLVFARTTTGRYVAGDDNDGGAFGAGGTWRHSYRWDMYLDSPGVWRVHYPDGAVIRFKSMPVSAPAAGGATPPADPYLRCISPGVSDRLDASSHSPDMILHRSDGGTVYFKSTGTNAWQSISITDPFNQTTNLAYYTSGTNAGRLWMITEPAGRWLQLTYITFNGGNLVGTVTASNGQSVSYYYSISGGSYTELTSVIYNSDLNASGQALQASYTYQPDNTGAGLRPLLKTCSDPHFPGPMTNIQYQFVQGSSAVYGQLQAEIDLSSGASVSSYNQSTLTETRGDGATSKMAFSGYLLTGKTDYDNGLTQYGYDQNNFSNGVLNANNHNTGITSEPYTGKPTTISRPDGSGGSLITTISYGGTYATNPYWVTQVTDPRGNPTTIGRDSNNRVKSINYPDGTYETFSYNSFGQVLTHRKRDGDVHTFQYDPSNNGHLTQATDSFNLAAGRWKFYTYDSCDRPYEVTDYNGHHTWYQYNGRHLVTQIKHDDLSTINYTYDSYGNQLTAKDELLHVTTSSYDSHNRRISVKVPVNAANNVYRTTLFTYETGTDTTGNANTKRTYGTKTLPSGKKIKRIYTGNGRVHSVTRGYGNPDATTDTYTYDALGDPLTVTDANNIVQSTYTYDAMDRKSSLTDAQGHVSTWTYYPAGNAYAGWPLTVSRPGAAVGAVANTSYTAYDAAGRVRGTQDPSGHTTGASYNLKGQMSSIGDENGSYVYTYDPSGRPSTLTFPDNTTQAWTYDGVGNALTYKNRANYVQTFQYDDRNRPTQATWNDGATSPRIWAYDVASRLNSINSYGGDISFTYEDSGLPLSESDGNNYVSGGVTNTTSYTRDADGNISSMTYPAGDVPNYSYDDQNRCTGLSGFSLLGFQGEEVADRTLGDGVVSQYYYQPNGRVYEIYDHHDAAPDTWPSNNISARFYGFAPDGQVTWEERIADGGASGSALDNGIGNAYAYNADHSVSIFDALYNIADAQENTQGDCNPQVGAPAAGAYGATYTYDGSGNRTTYVEKGVTINYAADGENRYQGSLYDANGDTTNSAVGWTYAYDAEGRMTSATRQSDGYAIGFGYDGLNRLIYQNAGGLQPTIFCYAGNQRIEERALTGNTSLYRYFHDAPGSDSIVFRQTTSTGARLYYLSDPAGNTTHVTNDAGQVVEQYVYDAYGTPMVYTAAGTPVAGNQSTCDNRYLFHGSAAYEWLSLPGLYYCRNRMYLPAHGRWLQPDPSGFAGGDINLYRYCDNDPVNMLDQSGESIKSNAIAAGEGVLVTLAGGVIVAVAAPELVAGLVFVGVEEVTAQAIVTYGTLSVAGAGIFTTVLDAGHNVSVGMQTGDWDPLSYDAGQLLAVGVGVTVVGSIAGWDKNVGGYDSDYNNLVSTGQISQAQNDINWMATQPTAVSGAAADLLIAHVLAPQDPSSEDPVEVIDDPASSSNSDDESSSSSNPFNSPVDFTLTGTTGTVGGGWEELGEEAASSAGDSSDQGG